MSNGINDAGEIDENWAATKSDVDVQESGVRSGGYFMIWFKSLSAHEHDSDSRDLEFILSEILPSADAGEVIGALLTAGFRED